MGVPVAANIIVGGARIYYAPVGEAIPDETTVAYEAAWGGNWTRVGFTKAPVSMSYTQETADHSVEEALSPVKRTITLEDLVVETVLAELTNEYMLLASGMDETGVTTTAAGVSQTGYDSSDHGGEPILQEKAWGFEGLYQNSSGAQFPVRFFIHKATAEMGGELTFSWKNGEYPGITLVVKALADTSLAQGAQLFKMHRVTAAATA